MRLDRSGRHNFNFYYGQKHCLIKAVFFLQTGLEKCEKCLYSVNPELEKEISKLVEAKYLSTNQLEFKSVKELIDIYFDTGIKGLKEELAKISYRACKEGYSKVRYLGQVSYAIKETSKNDFLEFEEVFTEALVDTNISFLCTYDVSSLFDMSDKDLLVSKDILEKALKSHSFLQNGKDIYNCRELAYNT